MEILHKNAALFFRVFSKPPRKYSPGFRKQVRYYLAPKGEGSMPAVENHTAGASVLMKKH